MNADSDLRDRLTRAIEAIAVEIPAPAEAIHRGRSRRTRRTAALSFVVVLVGGSLAWGISALSDLGRDASRLRGSDRGSPESPSDLPPLGDARPLAAAVSGSTSRALSSRLYLIDPDGGSVMDITPDGAAYYAPAWSPDGSRLAVDRIQTRGGDVEEGIYVMSSDGSHLGLVRQLSLSPVSVWQIQWSPDGTRIAFVQVDISTSSRESEWVTQVMVMDADGGNLRSLTSPEDGQFTSFSWSPDGSHLVVTRQFVESDHRFGWDLYLLPSDGGEITQLTADGNSRNPTWSPDGSRIGFEGFEGSRFLDRDLYVMNVDGTGRTRLTATKAVEGHPVWSPDGTTIAFARFAGPSDCPIMTIRPDGTGEEVVITSADLGGCVGGLAW